MTFFLLLLLFFGATLLNQIIGLSLGAQPRCVVFPSISCLLVVLFTRARDTDPPSLTPNENFSKMTHAEKAEKEVLPFSRSQEFTKVQSCACV